MTNVKITNIHENKEFPGVIYAELREANDNSICVMATLEYIFRVLDEGQYNCLNPQKDKWGNWKIVS